MSKFHVSLTSTPQVRVEIGKDVAGLSLQDVLDLGVIVINAQTPRLGYDPNTGIISGYPSTPNTPYIDGETVCYSDPPLFDEDGNVQSPSRIYPGDLG